MSSKRLRRRPVSERSTLLFAVADPKPPPKKLIEWPDDPKVASKIIARCEKLADERVALEEQGYDFAAWHDRSMAMLTSLIEWTRVYPEEDAKREAGIYTDGFRLLVLGLARGPGLGMSLLGLASITQVPTHILAVWLADAGIPITEIE